MIDSPFALLDAEATVADSHPTGAAFPEYDAAGPVERAILDEIAAAEDAANVLDAWQGKPYAPGYDLDGYEVTL